MTFDPKATWMFARGRRNIVARAIATRTLPGREVVILRDTSDALWVAEWTDKGGQIKTGPVTLKDAVRAAEGVVYGVPDHGSIAALVNDLALGLLMFNAAVEVPGLLNPANYPIDAQAPEVRPC